jgi:hypothetical protein
LSRDVQDAEDMPRKGGLREHPIFWRAGGDIPRIVDAVDISRTRTIEIQPVPLTGYLLLAS